MIPVLVLALFFSPLISAGEASAGAGAKPIISCEQPKFDFGEVAQGRKIFHEFVVANKGTANLSITALQPSCGCMIAQLTLNIVPPGKTTTITMTFDSVQFTGPIHKTLDIVSNDPATPALRLDITGSITAHYQVTPDSIDFQRVHWKSGYETRIVVHGLNGHEPVIASATFDTDVPFDVSYGKKSDSDDDIISLKLKPASKPRPIVARLIIEFQDSEMSRLLVPVTGVIMGDISYFPPLIFFGNIRASDPISRTVMLRIENPDVKIISVKSVPPILTTTFANSPNDAHVTEVRIAFKDTVKPGPIMGSIVIMTTSDQAKTIKIPFEGTIIK